MDIDKRKIFLVLCYGVILFSVIIVFVGILIVILFNN